jgi:hypothetical protein
MTMRLTIGIIVSLLAAASLRAQPASAPATGTIVGTVLMPDGRPAPDCIVTIQQAAVKMREGMTVATDSNGRFKLEKVPEGDYNLNVRTRDLKGRAIRSLSVTADKTTDVGKLTLKMK